MKIRFLYILILIYVLQGCFNNKKINQFEKFAQAGNIYSNTLMVLSEEAGNIAIDVDSYILVNLKANGVSKDDRINSYKLHDKNLNSYLSELRLFREHSTLLKKYFNTLILMTDSEASTSIVDVSTGLVDQLQSISPSIESAKIGGTPIKGFLTKSIPFVVSSYKSRILEHEFKKHAVLIEKELNLQQAFLEALAEGLEADIQDLLKFKEYELVIKQYINDKPLPRNWIDKRHQLLSPIVVMGSIENAIGAAKKLRENYMLLAQNKITISDINDLYIEINAMLDVIELVK